MSWAVFLFHPLILCCSLITAPAARGSEADVRKSLSELLNDDSAVRKAAIDALAKSGETRLIKFFSEVADGNVKEWRKQLYVYKPKDSFALLDPLAMTAVPEVSVVTPEMAKEFKDFSPTRVEKMRMNDAAKIVGIYSRDYDTRLVAIKNCGTYALEKSLPILTEMLKTEPDKNVQTAIEGSMAMIQLANVDTKNWTSEQLAAVAKLGEIKLLSASSRLKELKKLNDDTAKNPDAAAKLATSIAQIQSWQSSVNGVSYAFSGLSQGSILVLMALGLSIIFGMMGVINMAHGELMMIGAYATFMTQKLFELIFRPDVGQIVSPTALNTYFIVAIPFSFIAAASVGYLIERLVVRHLYGRPLDSMLATWGISLVLIQIIRLIFGNNIGVNSPSWMQGGFTVLRDVTFAYNRCIIIGFCIACILLMFYIINKTKLGLLLRATVQNRNMAASLGVHTRRVDGFTFALGSGLAGLAGCALTQVGGVSPDMGSNYIVDSFLVVVTGGVGKLAGAIWAGMGLGMMNKCLEPYFLAVWGKVLVLMAVVFFLQKRPSGLFPAKGRNADV